ncbi:uncharacterized protein EI90DRAFT_3014416 [Cantharellus anzutake]|uniref:uncharacterized protein n=1 Tax=Cantharellus anzutake TaxID=1750568 RepID=UPI001906E522|nr:uncharacterized protein EI90DRAFT_3014416 [Cantharellus anzutake]KAF8335791.1 hypothetical protein EI90DRAFT_3014416 [Cantharellus anzutake]
MHNPNACVSLATQTTLSPRGNILARVTIVSESDSVIIELFRDILLDVLVLPIDEVIDYFSANTGFQPSHFVPSRVTANTISFEQARYQAQSILHGAADPSSYRSDQGPRFILPDANGDGFQNIVRRAMNRTIREGFENTVEDARAAMDLYRSCAANWEALIASSIWPCLLAPEQFRQWYL